MTETHDDADVPDDEVPMVDPRFTLANERTFLSWIRTSLALIATGVAVEALAPPLDPQLRLAGALVFAGLGLVAAVQAWFGWRRSHHALIAGRQLPAPAMAAFVTGGVVLAVALLGLGLLA
jgi:putative membrane protein